MLCLFCLHWNNIKKVKKEQVKSNIKQLNKMNMVVFENLSLPITYWSFLLTASVVWYEKCLIYMLELQPPVSKSMLVLTWAPCKAGWVFPVAPTVDCGPGYWFEWFSATLHQITGLYIIVTKVVHSRPDQCKQMCYTCTSNATAHNTTQHAFIIK